MTYWTIAPFAAADRQFFDQVLAFDLSNNTISIGWSQLGNLSAATTRDALSQIVARAFPQATPGSQARITAMTWAFSHEISVGDTVVARRGRSVVAAIGRVTRTYYFQQNKNPLLAAPDEEHPNFIDVQWEDRPRNLVFKQPVFPMSTVAALAESRYLELIGDQEAPTPAGESEEAVDDEASFALERYLEEFIVSNFQGIFRGALSIYRDETDAFGQQYQTDVGPIDILAFDRQANEFVVIELKKGRSSDQVVGQILRYMGWVHQNMCRRGEKVRGLIICGEHDPRLSYAVRMVPNVQVRYYRVNFSLVDN